MKAIHSGLAMGLMVSLLLPVPVVLAQERDPAPAATDEKDEDEIRTLDRITVTARKREETLHDVPISMTAFTPRMLDTLNIQDLGDLDAQVPNLAIRSPPNSSSTITVRMRGIGQGETWWAFDPAVGIYLDDVFVARPQGAMLDVFDVGRIEALRGPQGTLYGKNTIGGAIRYIPRELPAQVEGRAEATVGSYDQRDFKAAIGGPLGGDDSGLRARVAAARLTRDGFGHDLVTGEEVSDKDTAAARLTLGAFAGDSFDLQFALDWMEDDSNRRGRQLLAPLRGYRPLPGRYDVRDGIADSTLTRVHGVSATANWRPGGDWVFKYVVARRESETRSHIEYDGTPAAVASIAESLEDEQVSHELQANFDGTARARGVMGLYLFDGKAGGILLSNFQNVIFGDVRGSMATESVALYSDWTFDLGQRFKLEAGVRWTDEDKRSIAFNRRYLDPARAGNFVLFADFDKTASFQNLSPRLALDYSFDGGAMAYALLARGFKSGGYNMRADTLALPRSANPIDDERVDSIELGSKLALLEESLFLNLAYFHNKYDDIQLSVGTSYDSNGDGIDDAVFGDFLNAGTATVRGIEAEYQWLPTPHWLIGGHLAWLDAQYDRFIDAGVDTARSQRFINSPEYSGALNVEYRRPMGPSGSLSLRGSWSYETETLHSTSNRLLRQGAYGLFNAGIIWHRDDHLSFSLQGTNLLDEAYRTGGGLTFGALTATYGAPRQVSLSARYEF
jgi:iron complex outermembrane recepter protein